MSHDKIIYLMNEIDNLKVEMEELHECGDLESMLEKAIEISDLDNLLLAERAK